MLKTFIISLVVFVVAYFIRLKMEPYFPWGVKASKNEWISGSGFVVSLIFCWIAFVAAIVAWFLVLCFACILLEALGFPDEVRFLFFVIAVTGTIVWLKGLLNQGKKGPPPDPHSWACGDKGMP